MVGLEVMLSEEEGVEVGLVLALAACALMLLVVWSVEEW